MKRNKIAIIGTAGLPAKYAGFETLAAHLVENLSSEYDFSVYCSGKQYARRDRATNYNGAKLIYLPLQADGLQGLVYDVISTIHALFYAEVLLILGVSGSFLIPFVRLFTNKKVITSVDGYEWKRNQYGKAALLYRMVAGWLAIRFSHVNIDNKESMQDYTALRYATDALLMNEQTTGNAKYPFMDRPYAFKLCQISPDNNIDMILKAFVQAPQHQLVITGNWNKSEYGKSLRKTYAIFPNIHMLDPIYNQHELDMLRANSFAYIHGNQPGGVDAALLEAMFMGLPVISVATKNNQLTTEGKALYFNSATELATMLNQTRLGEFSKVGLAMQETAQRKYTWQLIATKYEYIFKRMLNKQNNTVANYQPKGQASGLRFDMGF
jgi:glycosyltransferase involved in cell wall biosynthesis